ncbi:xanthine permease [Niallia circulans]|uniref:nucleobase:cation symporter-2 family protein n=1 Tax=Niallia TaxID=2837506 RepID=UPI00077C7E32|nr:nucleobase:cation symporter-2 family protein [Niallia circulans]MDR4316385.1 purine permease [Niallia circulans]MED3838445.1 nucleobase:cation symporter-2 family protein [Niallia circulans]MED4243918.1 nucleobase:cation symporter-2 family protein [Niallia circulans]MED4246312.1 nucleobase:cation symporter-2 family protein [Niallia circulans]MED5098908.1 nucleobase:cation symporter-2 family protein [Niallia circulans]
MEKMSVKTWSIGLQHVLAMYAGAVLVPLIVGGALKLTPEQLTYLISIDLLTCGVATLLQVWKNKFFGIGLPVMLGCTFTAVGPMIAIGSKHGITAIYGAIIVSGIIVVLISSIFSKLVKFFPPVVTGSVVTIIGLTLIPVAFNDMAGGQGSADFGNIKNVVLAFGVLTIIILLNKFTTGFIKTISILIGIIIGTLIAAMMGMVDFAKVGEADWIHGITPFYFGMPTFDLTSIITMTLVAIVSLIESTGVYLALGDITNKKVSEKDLANGYRAEGIASVIGGIFNSFPYTAYSQNVGLVQLTGVKTKNVIYAAGTILVILGFIPKIAAITTLIPTAVLGGASLAMFGMVVSYGIKMLGQVDFNNQGNLLILACSIGMGLGVTVVPDIFMKFPESIRILFQSGIVAGGLTAIILNILFNIIPGSRAKTVQMEEKTAA